MRYKPFGVNSRYLEYFSIEICSLCIFFLSNDFQSAAFRHKADIHYKNQLFLAKFSKNECHFGYLDFSKYVLAMVFTIMYVGRVFGETTLHFMEILWENDHFFEIWGPFEPFLPIYRYPEYEMFFPYIILSSMTFSHQLSCFNIHNIQKIAFFAQIFTKWGPFWVPRFL